MRSIYLLGAESGYNVAGKTGISYSYSTERTNWYYCVTLENLIEMSSGHSTHAAVEARRRCTSQVWEIRLLRELRE